MALTDAGGNFVNETDFVVFGNTWSVAGAVGVDLRFPGQMAQYESGLFYNWNRQYDPTIARYTQPDPLGLVDGPSRADMLMWAATRCRRLTQRACSECRLSHRTLPRACHRRKMARRVHYVQLGRDSFLTSTTSKTASFTARKGLFQVHRATKVCRLMFALDCARKEFHGQGCLGRE